MPPAHSYSAVTMETACYGHRAGPGGHVVAEKKSQVEFFQRAKGQKIKENLLLLFILVVSYLMSVVIQLLFEVFEG